MQGKTVFEELGVRFTENEDGTAAIRIELVTLSELASLIREGSERLEVAERNSLYYAALVGKSLAEAKSKHRKRGRWSEWLANNFPKSARTAADYMRIASHWGGPILQAARNENRFPTSISECLRLLPKDRPRGYSPLKPSVDRRRKLEKAVKESLSHAMLTSTDEDLAVLPLLIQTVFELARSSRSIMTANSSSRLEPKFAEPGTSVWERLTRELPPALNQLLSSPAFVALQLPKVTQLLIDEAESYLEEPLTEAREERIRTERLDIRTSIRPRRHVAMEPVKS